MAKRVFQVLAMVLAVTVVGFVSFNAGASVGAGSASGDVESGGASLWQHLHAVGMRLHHGAGTHGHHRGAGFGRQVADVVERLDLTPEQTRHLEAIHDALRSLGGDAGGSLAELHEQLVAQFEQGSIAADALRPTIDRHLEAARRAAYSAGDELVALVNSLDADQREIVLEHLREADRHGGLH